MTVAVCAVGMSLFFVGKLRPQDVDGNLLALASGVCFALYFLLLRHSRAREVNRASSAIYGNLIVVAIAAPPFFAAARRGIGARDVGSMAYLASSRSVWLMRCSRLPWRAASALWMPASSAISNRC